MLALSFALSASLCWGVADFIGGVQARRIPLLRVMLISQLVGFAGVCVVVIARGEAPPSFAQMLPAIGAGLAGITALTAFYRALAIGTMSIVAPISATGVAVPVIVGIAGGERPALIQFVGILIATVGVVLASREQQGDAQPRVTRASVFLALVAALGFGSFFVGVRSTARVDVLWALFATRGTAVAALMIASLAFPTPSQRLAPASLVPVTIMGLLDLAANALFALASTRGLLSVVSVVTSLYPLATVVLARVVLGERVRRVQEVGIAAALAGVALIAGG